MGIQFNMICKLSIGKDSEKFHPYEEQKYASNWINRTLKFNATAGDNNFLLQVKGGKFEDEHNLVYLFSQSGVDDSGNKIKGEPFTIPFKERLTSPRLVEVAEWKKFVVDLEKPNFRWELTKALEKIKEGKELTDAEIKKFGASDEKGLENALEKSNKKRKEFVTEWDYAEFIKKLIDSGKYDGKKFRVSGEYQMQYSDQKSQFYSNYVPNRIYLANDDEEEVATATVDFYFDSNSLDAGSALENGKYYVNGYTFVHDKARKANVPAPYTVVINAAKDDSELEKKREKIQVSRFEVEDEDTVYQYGIVVNLLNGAQKQDISEDDLTEEQLDSIMLGEITLDDIRRELGGSIYGDRVVENVFSKPARGFSKGREETDYTSDDLAIKPLTNDEDETELFDDDNEDLFDDDDIL